MELKRFEAAGNLRERMMRKTGTTRYDVAEHLRTPEEMAACLEAWLNETKCDGVSIAKTLGDIACAGGHGAGGP